MDKNNITLRENNKYVVRKGACPALAGELVIIPGSMGSNSYLCLGKGNERMIRSASHGAGRAKNRFSMTRGKIDETALGLNGIDCITPRAERRIEEAPAAYKDVTRVIDAQVQAGVINVVAIMRPVLTFKA